MAVDIKEYTDVDYYYILDNLKDEEGLRYVAYLDTQGITSCGVGHNCISKPTKHIIGRNIKVGQSVTHQEVIKLFDADLLDVLEQLQKLTWFKSLSDKKAYVVISLCFNLGYSGLLKFKHFLDALEAGDNRNTIKELKNSKWATQVPNRCKKLTQLLL